MNMQIVMLLGQDGVTNGAVYALLALSIMLVFSVTRILLIPQGEFVAFAALTMAAMQSGRAVQLGWLVFALAVVATLMDAAKVWRSKGREPWPHGTLGLLAVAALALVLTKVLPLDRIGMFAQALLTIALVVPLGPLLYRVFFQAIAAAHSLVLLIVSIAVHVALVGTGLLMFGPEGGKTEPFSDAFFEIGPAMIASQTLWVIAATLALMGGLWVFFGKTLYGRALQATAVNRLGAELVGISPDLAGRASFTLAAAIGVLSGILIAPITTIYYDSGFIISLKGFVGAIIGGLTSFPVAALGALFIGQAEAFSTFWASSYKEVIVFTLLLPVLVWRSLAHTRVEDEE
ncbi:branched-chain amino acid ABC transporter permease [Pinisolibacter aquiterrae]|uniref:branched-chain amino acid ABC transporter permease n=1 Tax=Pinisolibacter aquiterrae TaxID=2815579 RepID=UPI001C3CB32B|nr:branched-chain amino acid ABC transporter permease [Pinisolibacter aquiterrae]MBV5265783.1 branched-chain amino acid ABC transporter permease [Pinisolibacter aquiterrae]MCC8236652.1 branched-chain amino acid ABC transporter permease [Pinisolibacter aquiterrae]